MVKLVRWCLLAASAVVAAGGLWLGISALPPSIMLAILTIIAWSLFFAGAVFIVVATAADLTFNYSEFRGIREWREWAVRTIMGLSIVLAGAGLGYLSDVFTWHFPAVTGALLLFLVTSWAWKLRG